MKISKVQNILNKFQLNLEDYDIHKLDINRVPNTTTNGRVSQVSLLMKDGTVVPLDQGTRTAHRINRHVEAIHVDIRYPDDTYKRMLLIK